MEGIKSIYVNKFQVGWNISVPNSFEHKSPAQNPFEDTTPFCDFEGNSLLSG